MKYSIRWFVLKKNHQIDFHNKKKTSAKKTKQNKKLNLMEISAEIKWDNQLLSLT